MTRRTGLTSSLVYEKNGTAWFGWKSRETALRKASGRAR